MMAHEVVMAQFTFYEFFCGGGMARAGLGTNWQCLFANDFDPKKPAAYRANWGDDIRQTISSVVLGISA
jgi:site-specific DNA-cytosine methylase